MLSASIWCYVLFLVLSHQARADNELATCISCDACEDANDACSEVTIAAGSQQEFCSNQAITGADEISSTVEISSIKRTASSSSCGKFDLEFYLQGSPSTQYSGVTDSRCYDPKVYMMDSSATVFLGSANGQVCAVLKCRSGQANSCKLKYQWGWSRISAAELAKAQNAATLIMVVGLGVAALFWVVSALVWFCCLRTTYENGGLDCCSLCAMLACCFPWILLTMFLQQCCGCCQSDSGSGSGGPQANTVGQPVSTK